MNILIFLPVFYKFFVVCDKIELVTPKEIIVYPNSCINITINEEILDRLIEVKFLSQITGFEAVVWSENFPKNDINYYFTRYVHDVGLKWISMCDLDHVVSDLYMEFEVLKNSLTSFYYSNKIMLAHCKYLSNCQNTIFPSKDDIIKSKTEIYTLKDTVKIRLKFKKDFQPIFLRFSICYYYSICNHVSIYSLMLYSVEQYSNFFIFNLETKVFSIHVVNYKLFQSTLHILYIDKYNNTRLLTTTFIYKNKFLKFKKKLNILKYYKPSIANITIYYIHIMDNTKPLSQSFQVSSNEFNKKVKFSNFIFESNIITWFTSKRIKYTVLSIDFTMLYQKVLIMDSYNLVIDYDSIQEGNISNTSTDSSLMIEKNKSKRTKNTSNTYIYAFLIIFGVIFVTMLILISFRSYLLYSKNILINSIYHKRNDVDARFM